jgi:hypothetical protein
MDDFIVLRRARAESRGPRDEKFVETAGQLAELLQVLAHKSQLLDNVQLSAYQERMDVLIGQMKETMQVEGIAYIGV